MGSLTNSGEFVALNIGLGPGVQNTGSITTDDYVNGQRTTGCTIELGTPNGSSNEHAYNILTSDANLGYAPQTAIFEQPSYGSDISTSSATNANAITFGPAQANWPSFSKILIRTGPGLTNTTTEQTFTLAYYDLPAPVTLANGESYIIPARALKFEITQNSFKKSFDVDAKRRIIDALLGIAVPVSLTTTPAIQSTTATLYGNYGQALVTVVPGTFTSLNQQSPEFLAAQPFTPNYNSFDTSAERTTYTGETRISNFNAITLTWPPDAVSTTSFTATHALIFTNAGFEIALIQLDTPRTFGPNNAILIPSGSLSVAFE